MNLATESTPPAMPRLSGYDDCAPTSCDSSTAGLFHPDTKRQALVAAYPELERICDELGFGDGFTLREWSPSCDWALLVFARAAQPPPSTLAQVPAQDWSMATIPELVADLVATHHVPLRRELARLRLILDHRAAAQPTATMTALCKIFHEFMDGLSPHLDQEECDLFPMCIALEEASRGHGSWDGRDATSLIRWTSHGHEECERRLHRTQELLRAARQQAHDPDLDALNQGLAALAADLVLHTAKEGDLLMPAAIFAGEQLSARHAGKHSH